MLIFIENTPRTYAWGSTHALADMLGTEPTGEPQAELWLGAHPGGPAHVAKATPEARTLIDLYESDPERYGVDGGPLPFLLKVLAIGAPLSLQVHPDRDQARRGFAAEEAAGVPIDARDRNYGDPNHKPELLVALDEVTALSGFRPLAEVRRDLELLARLLRLAGDAPAAAAVDGAARRLAGEDPEALRREFLAWAFSGDPEVARAVAGIDALRDRSAAAGVTGALSAIADVLEADEEAVSELRARALGELSAAHPGDPGVLVSLLLHLVRLAPGEAIYLRPRQLHAYLGGVAVEVMASSDNVLRAGLTRKHVDIAELCRVVDPGELADPRFPGVAERPGLTAWRPDVDDFALLRARVCEAGEADACPRGAAGEVVVDAPAPLVLVVTAGRVRIERPAAEIAEVAAARRGQSLYVSAGEPLKLTGHGEVFLATVGARRAG